MKNQSKVNLTCISSTLQTALQRDCFLGMGVRLRRFSISIHAFVSTELYLQKQGMAGLTFSTKSQ